MAVRSEGGATLMVGGKVLYRSSNTELKDDSTVSLPETGTAYVILKDKNRMIVKFVHLPDIERRGGDGYNDK